MGIHQLRCYKFTSLFHQFKKKEGFMVNRYLTGSLFLILFIAGGSLSAFGLMSVKAPPNSGSGGPEPTIASSVSPTVDGWLGYPGASVTTSKLLPQSNGTWLAGGGIGV